MQRHLNNNFVLIDKDQATTMYGNCQTVIDDAENLKTRTIEIVKKYYEN